MWSLVESEAAVQIFNQQQFWGKTLYLNFCLSIIHSSYLVFYLLKNIYPSKGFEQTPIELGSLVVLAFYSDDQSSNTT